MGTRVSLQCNGYLREEFYKNWQENFGVVNFPGAPERDEFGILIKPDPFDLYDQSFEVDRPCPKCGSNLISHPTCEETCSNDECDYDSMNRKKEGSDAESRDNQD